MAKMKSRTTNVMNVDQGLKGEAEAQYCALRKALYMLLMCLYQSPSHVHGCLCLFVPFIRVESWSKASNIEVVR